MKLGNFEADLNCRFVCRHCCCFASLKEESTRVLPLISLMVKYKPNELLATNHTKQRSFQIRLNSTSFVIDATKNRRSQWQSHVTPPRKLLDPILVGTSFAKRSALFCVKARIFFDDFHQSLNYIKSFV